MIEGVKNIIKEKFGENVEFEEKDGEFIAIVNKDFLFEFLKFLRENPFLFFDFLIDITGVDHYNQDKRFEIVYHLYSFKFSRRIRVKTFIEEPEIRSCVPIWKSASWSEREIYEMFGIYFFDHPNLKSLLLWDKFENFPLRKDFQIDFEITVPDFKDLEE